MYVIQYYLCKTARSYHEMHPPSIRKIFLEYVQKSIGFNHFMVFKTRDILDKIIS
jgi:hypothetical protein